MMPNINDARFDSASLACKDNCLDALRIDLGIAKMRSNVFPDLNLCG